MQRAYIDQLLDVDAAVIGDNATHIVVSVRIDKRTLSQNHQILVALSELAHREPESRQGWRRAAVVGACAAAIFHSIPGKAVAVVVTHPLTLTLNWLFTVHEAVF